MKIKKALEFGWKYYRKGVLMASSEQKRKIEQELNKDLWDCPQCGRHTMEEAQFSTGGEDPEPGLLCFHCHYMLSGEHLHDYMVDEDGRRDI